MPFPPALFYFYQYLFPAYKFPSLFKIKMEATQKYNSRKKS